jgi:hypothetical protein
MEDTKNNGGNLPAEIKESLPAGQAGGYIAATLTEGDASELAGVKVKLARVKVPAGGGIQFESPTENPDEPAMVKELTGIVVYSHPTNAYYKQKYTDGNQAPDCASRDGVTGLDAETAEIKQCAKCELGKFKLREDGVKACLCKQKRRLFLWREGEAFPIIFTVPVASVKYFDAYASGLRQFGGKFPSHVVTKITLKKATNQNGIVFSEVRFNKERNIEPAELTAAAKMRAQVIELASRVYDDTDESEAQE